MALMEAMKVVLESPVVGMADLTRVSELNSGFKQSLYYVFENNGMQYAEAVESLRLYNAQLKNKHDTVPAVYLLLHTSAEVRARILRNFSILQVQEHVASGAIRPITKLVFKDAAQTRKYKQALDRCHVSCCTPIGIFCMLYEISKVLDRLDGDENVDISLEERLIQNRGSLVIVNSPNIQGILDQDASVSMALFPSAWLENSQNQAGQILRSIPQWFIKDPRIAYVFALDKFQCELGHVIDNVSVPTGRITNFATTDLCFSILSSPIGLALYRDTNYVSLHELYGLGHTAGALPAIRKLVYSYPGFVLVQAAGPEMFADIILHCPTGVNAYLASANFATAAKGLVHVMRYHQNQQPVIESYGIHPKFVRPLILAAAQTVQLSEEQLLATCAQLGTWSAGNATTHVWLPHELLLDALLTATSSSNSTEHSATTHIPALLKALDALRPSSVDDRAARALMGSQLLQDPSCADSAVKFAENASIVAVTLVTFVEDDKAAAITSANNDVKTFIFQSCTKHVGKIHDLLNSGESLLAKVVIYAVDTATGTADVKDAGIPVSALLSVVSSEDGRRLQDDGVLDVSDPKQIMEVTAFLTNPTMAQGLAENVWDANFLVKLRITPTASLLDGLKNDLIPKTDVLALPRTVFGTFDALHAAILAGFLTVNSDSYRNMLVQLDRYHEDEMTNAQITRARGKSGEKEAIVTLKLLFNHYEYQSIEAFSAWEQLSKLGMTYDDCVSMPLPCLLLLLDAEVYTLIEESNSCTFEHIARLPVHFAEFLVDDIAARELLQEPWFPLDHCSAWSNAQVESVKHLCDPRCSTLLRSLVPGHCTFEELTMLTVPALEMIRKKANLKLITDGPVKVAELVKIGSNADVHLADVLFICFKSGLIRRAVDANDWENLSLQLQDQNVQAFMRREAMLFEEHLLYSDEFVGDWDAEDLPFLARLKDSELDTYDSTFSVLSTGAVDRKSFRKIVSISPSWFSPGSAQLYASNVLNANLIEKLHAKAPQLQSLVGYLNFNGIARTYNRLVYEAGDGFSFELFLQPAFSAEIIQHLLLGRFATALETKFLTYAYFIHPDKSPLEATGRLMAKRRPRREQALFNSLMQQGIHAGHIRSYQIGVPLEDATAVWQATAASDPLDVEFLKSANQTTSSQAAIGADDSKADSKAGTSANENPIDKSENPFVAGVAKARSDDNAHAKSVAGTTFAFKPQQPPSEAKGTGTEAAQTPASTFSFQTPQSGSTSGRSFTFKSTTTTQNLAAAGQRRRNAKAAKEL